MGRRVNSLRVSLLGSFVAVSIATSAWGWGASGHRIVAAVGEDHLSEAVAERALTLTEGRSLAQIATWPDSIRSEPSWNCSQPWHFLTVEDWETLEEALARKGSFRDCKLPKDVELPQNVVEAIDFFSAILAGEEDKRAAFVAVAELNEAEFYAGSVELSALSFLVHLVGDVHQPLHVGRGGDLGGNRVSVNWFGEVSNLHSSWDEGLIESEHLSYSEFVDFLEAEQGRGPAVGNLDDVKAWAAESRKVRFQVYEIYGKTSRDNYLPELSYQYAHDQMELLKGRLYKGGRRLAARLDEVLAGSR